MEKVDKNSCCADCSALIGAGIHIQPHKNLQQTRFKEVNSMFGSVDEYYYTCKVCEKTWLHETGNYGNGWVE